MNINNGKMLELYGQQYLKKIMYIVEKVMDQLNWIFVLKEMSLPVTVNR